MDSTQFLKHTHLNNVMTDLGKLIILFIKHHFNDVTFYLYLASILVAYFLLTGINYMMTFFSVLLMFTDKFTTSIKHTCHYKVEILFYCLILSTLEEMQ